jgi:phosphoribosylformimino-5-aminoimidazole carboxamide ribotide isomerase
MIILPAIDLREGRCVRLQQGRASAETVYGDDPASVARRWVEEGARWLHIVDLDAALAGPSPTGVGDRPLNLQRLEEIHQAVPDTPIQFGGGLRSVAAIETALALGARRVVLGTAAVDQPDLVAEALRRFGPDCVVAGIDALEGWVATHGWQQTSGVRAIDLGQTMHQLGVVRAVYTDVARDGMLAGANVEATAALARTTGLAVIASGGVASLEDVARLQARSAEGIEGVIIGQALYRGTLSLPEAIRLAQGSF